MSRLLLISIFFLFLSGAVRPCFAHDVDELTDPYDKIERYGRLLEKISRLESLDGALEPRPAVPVVRIQGQDFYLNTVFYSLVDEVVRLYQDEIHHVCADCIQPSPEEITEEAQSLVAKGWLKNFGEKVGQKVLVRYGGEFVDLGSRYGTAAGLLKVAGELAEDALLVVFKLPGAHFLCEVITMAIAYYSGGLLTTYRTWAQARSVNKSSMSQLVRLAATSWVVRRSLRRIHLDIGPVELKGEEELEKSSGEMGHWLAHELDDEPKVRTFLERLSSLSQIYHEKLAALEEQAEAAEGHQLKKIQKQTNKLRRKLVSATKIKQKIFEGRRRGLSLYLLRRKGAHTLYQTEIEMNSMLKGTHLWMVPITSNYTRPGLGWSSALQSTLSGYMAHSRQQYDSTVEHSPINKVLIAEAQKKGVSTDMANRLFDDIAHIFDTESTRRERYARLLLLQGAFGEFLPKLIKNFVSTVREQLAEKDASFANLKRTTSLQWMAGQVTYYTNQYIDFLRTVSLVKGHRFTFEEPLAKDYFLKILKALETISQLKCASGHEDVDHIRGQLKKDLQDLQASMFWYEKRAAHRILPLRESFSKIMGLGKYNIGRKRANCEQLYF